MTMRTIPIPALALCLLTPLLALAQPNVQGPGNEQMVTSSPSFWFWLIAAAIAVVAFVVSNIVVGRRGGPHSRRHA
jgi:hypothetical protein